MKPASYPESFLSSHSTSVLAFAVLRKQCVEDSSVWMPLCKRSAGLPPEPMEGGGSIPHFGSRSQRRPVFLNTDVFGYASSFPVLFRKPNKSDKAFCGAACPKMGHSGTASALPSAPSTELKG